MDTQNIRPECSEKILPVQYPLITSYTYHANEISILLNYPQTRPWVYSRFIQLFINRNYKDYTYGDFLLPSKELEDPLGSICVVFSRQKIHKDLIEKKWGSVIDFLIDCIDFDYYAHLTINTFFIPYYENYNKRHAYHDIFVYGYDTKEKVLHVADFFINAVYSYQKVSFDDFNRAYQLHPDLTEEDYFDRLVTLLGYREAKNYKFDINTIIGSIKEYLLIDTQNCWYMYNNDKIAYGVEYYDILESVVKSIPIKESGYYYFDMRPFHALYDHKKMMLLRIKYLGEEGYLSDADYFYNCYKDIENQTLVIRNLLLKGRQTCNDYSDRITGRLREIKEKEIKVLHEMLGKLGDIPNKS